MCSSDLEAESPRDALAEWLRAMVKFSSTKRRMTSALLATLGTDSELLSACATVIRGSAESLLASAKQAGVEACVFDRAGYLYHGRVKALADGAREGGLKF